MAPRQPPTTTTGTQPPSLNSLLGSTPSGGGGNPTGVTAEDNMKVSGVGALLRLNWGDVTVAQAIAGFNQLVKASSGNTPGAKAAKAALAQLQEEMFVAGYYGAKRPNFGTLAPGNTDASAFRKLLVNASQSGQKVGTFLTQAAQAAQQAGTAGGGTHIIPAARIQEKVWSPNDILAAINAATTASGENLAQRLIGRNFTAQELQGAADTLNSAQATQTAADVAGVLAQQQQDIGTSQAVYGAPAATTVLPGGAVTPAQVAAEVKRQGGSVLQQQVAAALVSGIESSGDPRALAGGKGPAAGLFQFEPNTWLGNGGGKFAPNAQSASWQQQVTVFLNTTKGNHFGPWGPDLVANSGNPNDPHNPAYGYSGAPQAGSKVANAIASLGPNIGTPSTSAAGVTSPVGVGLKQGRVDQGVDYSGKGPLFAIGSGTIVSVTNPGWPGGAFIALKLDNPIDPQHSLVYYAEDIAPQVKVGEHVGAGRQIGTAKGGPHGIEIGWGNPTAVGEALAAGSYKEGQQTAEGQHFLSYISGQAAGGSQGQTTDIYQNPVVDQVPATLDPAAAATQYAETKLAPDYQKNNLLKVFQQIETSLKTPPTPNAHVRQTPVSMK